MPHYKNRELSDTVEQCKQMIEINPSSKNGKQIPRSLQKILPSCAQTELVEQCRIFTVKTEIIPYKNLG
jgi:hypothetical protein